MTFLPFGAQRLEGEVVVAGPRASVDRRGSKSVEAKPDVSHFTAAANQHQLDLLAGLDVRVHARLDVGWGFHRLALHFHDHVAGAETLFGGGAFGIHIAYHHALDV